MLPKTKLTGGSEEISAMDRRCIALPFLSQFVASPAVGGSFNSAHADIKRGEKIE